MGRARVTGDRQRERRPKIHPCRAHAAAARRLRPPRRSPSLSSRFALRAPWLRAPFPSLSRHPVPFSLSLTLSATLRCRAPCLPRVYPRHFLSPLFAFFPLAVLVLAFPLLRARPLPHRVSSFPSRVHSFRRCSLLSFSSSRVLPPSLPPYIFSLRFPSRAVPPFCSVSSVSFSAFTSSTCRSTSRVHFPPPARDRARYRLFFTLTFSSPNIRLQFSSFAPFLLYTRPTDLPAYPTPLAAIPAFVAQPLFRRNAVNRNIAKR